MHLLSPKQVFRIVSILEAVTWSALLFAMRSCVGGGDAKCATLGQKSGRRATNRTAHESGL